METFLMYASRFWVGILTTFDRMIKGHLTMFYPKGAFARFLNRQSVLLKEFKPYVEDVSQQLKRHAEELAQQVGRPFRYLETAWIIFSSV
jgi:hypothetical protein